MKLIVGGLLMNKNRLVFLAIIVFTAISAVSYIGLGEIFEEESAPSTQVLQLENYANELSIGSKTYTIENARLLSNENTSELYFFTGSKSETSYTSPSGEAKLASGENQETINTDYTNADLQKTQIPAKIYETAKNTSEPVLVYKETKTKNPKTWPYSISLGITAAAIFVAAILTRQELRGTATSKLLEEGLENLTVRDAEIFSQIMKMEEFTIPQLMKKTKTPKVATWRTVKKLKQEGLVKETERTRAPSQGLGGRGKPSKVYEFTGEKGKKS